jgi:hypothetical protein
MFYGATEPEDAEISSFPAATAALRGDRTVHKIIMEFWPD